MGSVLAPGSATLSRKNPARVRDFDRWVSYLVTHDAAEATRGPSGAISIVEGRGPAQHRERAMMRLLTWPMALSATDFLSHVSVCDRFLARGRAKAIDSAATDPWLTAL